MVDDFWQDYCHHGRIVRPSSFIAGHYDLMVITVDPDYFPICRMMKINNLSRREIFIRSFLIVSTSAHKWIFDSTHEKPTSSHPDNMSSLIFTISSRLQSENKCCRQKYAPNYMILWFPIIWYAANFYVPEFTSLLVFASYTRCPPTFTKSIL